MKINKNLKKKQEKLKLEIKKVDVILPKDSTTKQKTPKKEELDEEIIDEKFFSKTPKFRARAFLPSLQFNEAIQSKNLEDEINDAPVANSPVNNAPIVYNAPSYSPTATYNTSASTSYTTNLQGSESMSDGISMAPSQEQLAFRHWQEQNIGPITGQGQSKTQSDNYDVNIPRESNEIDTGLPFMGKRRRS